MTNWLAQKNQQVDPLEQVDALIEAAMNLDQEAIQTLKKLMESNPKIAQYVQLKVQNAQQSMKQGGKVDYLDYLKKGKKIKKSCGGTKVKSMSQGTCGCKTLFRMKGGIIVNVDCNGNIVK